MAFIEKFKDEIFNTNPGNFEDKVFEVFNYQAAYNPIYKEYIQKLRVNVNQVQRIEDIPFLPIEFFKTHQVISGNPAIQTVFESSGTTGQKRSKHYIADIAFYQRISKAIFELFYGKLSEYAFLALLPSYAERNNSSLIYMMQYFISMSSYPQSGFYLDKYDLLIKEASDLQQQNKKLLLMGVTFALLDLSEIPGLDFSGIDVVETGGMKGRKKEMIREEVHDILKRGFHANRIGSEYGMTELLSQAYAYKDGLHKNAPWMKILLRSTDDPFEKGYDLKRGGINVIDLANIDSCAFIETKDIGQIIDNEYFTVLGRFDNTEIRGCNLMVL